jgi:apolipoprotein D and lipocalin family protein
MKSIRQVSTTGVMFTSLLLVGLLVSTSSGSEVNKCVYAAPQAQLNYTDYQGEWYEIGRIQTPGGAFFQKDCVCTMLNVSFPDQDSSNGTVDNRCRFLKPDGDMVAFKSDINQMGLPGQWISTFELNKGVHVSYTIIEHGTDEDSGEEYSVEYDCGSQLIGGTNYCIHILGRTPTMSDALRERLIKNAEALDINTRNLPFVFTNQSSSCEYR